MLVYYSHCMAIYNTTQEERDLTLLKQLGYEILNPNDKIHQENCKSYDNPMDYFKELVKKCDVLAFRGLPDGKIPCGVFAEVATANNNRIPVFELPVNIKLRNMSVEETRAYLMEVGQR